MAEILSYFNSLRTHFFGLHSMMSSDETERYASERLFRDLLNIFNLPEWEINSAVTSIRSQLSAAEWNWTDYYSGIDFNNRSLCCAYLKRYAACHCALSRHCSIELFWRYSNDLLSNPLSKMCLKVVSVGGGPGNDLVGFCSALEQTRRSNLLLSLTVIDKKKGWREVFGNMCSLIQRDEYGNVSRLFKNVQVSTHFVECDLTLDSTPSAIGEADIILLTKVLSVLSQPQKMQMMKNIFGGMKRDAILLFIDINSAFVAQMAVACNMTVLMRSASRSRFPFKSWINRAHSITHSTFEMCVVIKP